MTPGAPSIAPEPAPAPSERPGPRGGLGLRGQLLLALLLVTVGAVVSVGAITVWQVRQALAADRFEHVLALTQTARALAEAELASAPPLATPEALPRLSDTAQKLATAVGADEAAFFAGPAHPLWPTQPPSLASDTTGIPGALAGAPAHVQERPGDPSFGLRVVTYAEIAPAGHEPIALRLSFPIDAAVDAALARARASVMWLGAIDGLILVLVAGLLLRSTVLKPALALERAARRVAAGDLDARVETRGPGELGRLADAFERMTGSLREGRDSLIRSEKLAGVGRLAAGVAHEVGNPLAAILGYVEMLLADTPAKPVDDALRRDMLERVRAETQRIHRIIQELLEYARPPQGAGPASAEVGKTVEAAVSLARATGRTRGVKLEIDLPADLPLVRATAERLTQVLLNLLLNAADATDGKGKIVVSARAPASGTRVIVRVADDGPGVAADVRDKIFDPFFTTKDPGRGTGLGLAVCLSIIESAGGTIRLLPADPANPGARFDVDLPIA